MPTEPLRPFRNLAPRMYPLTTPMGRQQAEKALEAERAKAMNLPNTITLFSAPHDVEWECRETNAGRKMAVTRIFPRNHAFVAASGIHTYWMTNGKEDYLSTHAAFVAVAREIRDQLAASNLTIVGTFAHATILGIAVFSDDTGPTG